MTSAYRNMTWERKVDSSSEELLLGRKISSGRNETARYLVINSTGASVGEIAFAYRWDFENNHQVALATGQVARLVLQSASLSAAVSEALRNKSLVVRKGLHQKLEYSPMTSQGNESVSSMHIQASLGGEEGQLAHIECVNSHSVGWCSYRVTREMHYDRAWNRRSLTVSSYVERQHMAFESYERSRETAIEIAFQKGRKLAKVKKSKPAEES